MTSRPPLPRQRHDGSIHWTVRSITALAEWEHVTIGAILEQLPATLGKVTEWTPSPIAGNGGGERVSGGQYDEGGNKNGPVPSFVIRKDTNQTNDIITADVLILIQSLLRTQQSIDTMTRMMSRLAILDADTVKAVFTTQPERAGAGPCGNHACGRYCTGERGDRLIKSRCRACYDYRRVEGDDRPHDQCHAEPVAGCSLCQYRDQRARAVVETH